jgi:hypothetical protein
MEFPERELALTWVGRTLVDRDGTEIGACTAVFTDDATRVTEWVCSEVGGTAVFIPAVGATESGEQVQVSVSRDDVANAPAVGGTERISDDEEAALYRHYGIPHSREASSSLLPTGEPSDATAEEDLGTAASPRPQSAAPTPAAAGLDGGSTGPEPATAPAAPDLHPVAEAGDGPSAPAASGRRRVLPVAGGLAGVGMAVGAVLGLRRLRLRRRRPPTRTERILARGRAASSALSAGTGRVVRRPGPAGAVAAVPAAALTLRALRRRRSRTDPDAD